jgi:hypothetical protein
MPHRDDREALDAKLEAQARELAETKEELERLRAANLRKASELERMRVAQPPSPRAVVSDALRRQIGVLVVATSVLVGGLSFSAIHLAARAHRPLHACGASASAAAATTPVHVVFPAAIVRVAGSTTHEAGEVCRVDATMLADGNARAHAVSELSVTCGDETLYAPTSAALGDALGLPWASEHEGHVRYEIALASGATRLDSWDGRAVIATTSSRIELMLAPLSDEVTLALASPTPERAMVRAGHVTASSTLEVGTECTVARRPARADGYATRVVIRCGEHTLYGDHDTGFTYPGDDARLIVDDDISAVDGDARMTLDLVRSTLHLEDGRGLSQVSVDIALDPTGPTTEI